MAIGTAVQRGAHVDVYDQEGRLLVMLPSGTGLNDGLQGYTSSSVSIRLGAWIYVYDEQGRQTAALPAA